MNAMAMVLLRALDYPFACDDIGAGLGLSATPEFQMVGLEQLLKSMERLIFEYTDDLVITDLVHTVDPSLQQAEYENDEQYQHTGREGDQLITGTNAHTQRCRHPDHGCRGNAIDLTVRGIPPEDNACSYKADTHHHIGGNPFRSMFGANQLRKYSGMHPDR